MTRSNDRMRLKLLIVTAVFLITSACGPNQRIINSSRESEAESNKFNEQLKSRPKLSSFDSDLQAMRDADFNFIYVFRRKDGGVFDTEDKRFVADRTPPEINRRRLGDEGKWIILGSNFRVEPDSMKDLKERFAFEDYSKPESELPKNTNSAANSK